MKSKYTLAILTGCLFSLGTKSQTVQPQVLNTTGNYTQVGGYLFDYSVGELTLVETFVLPELMLTQGFMQPLFLSATGGGDLNIKVYPDVSPNNDGQGNESLHIEGIEAYPENDIQIFNRWGNLIFKTHGYHNTDNSFKGKANTGILVDGAEVPDGTNYYILKVFDPVGAKTHIYNGFFVIKRK